MGDHRLVKLLILFSYYDLCPDWVQLFEILLAIDVVLGQVWSLKVERGSAPNNDGSCSLTRSADVRGQTRSLVNLAAYYGMHQFIDWFLQRSEYPEETRDNQRDQVIYEIARSTIAAFDLEAPLPGFAVKTLDVLFNHEPARMAKMVFPPESPVVGIPLWHAFLLHAWPFHTPASTQALELWLRNGANPHVAFIPSPELDHRVFIRGVYDGRDGSGHLELDNITEPTYYIGVPRGQKISAGSFTLRRFVELSGAENKQTLLQLIGEDLVDDVAEGPAPKLQHAE